MSRLIVSPLTPDRTSEAYPLIRASTGISFRRWSAYARLIRHRGGDVIVVTDSDDRIYGAAAFRAGTTLRHPHCLIVDIIAAFEMGEMATIKAELCGALQDEALRRGCPAILVQTPAPRGGTELGAAQWRGLGFAPESITVVHELNPADLSAAPGDQARK